MTIDTYKDLLTDEGRTALANSVAAFRQHYGENWFKEFAKTNPGYVEIVDLIANHNFEDSLLRLKQFAHDKISEQYGPLMSNAVSMAAMVFIDGARGDLSKLHKMIRAEIERPRF